ncbi:MAG: heme A synthase [Cryobacterium sp.]|nr:heme A synthase [Cryobacterium sp.]
MSSPKIESRFWKWFAPKAVIRRTKVLAWLSLASELAIVGTGGAVRLTASGLGCPNWPLCSNESLVPVPEQGIHAIIEFSNRMMTSVVGIIALLTFLALSRLRKQEGRSFWLSFSLLLLVIVQAAIGGVTVLSGLESYVVGIHYILSAIMVILATWLVWEVSSFKPESPIKHKFVAPVTIGLALSIAATVVIGVLTTGSGPHAGDSSAARNGLPTDLLEHLHAWPGYLSLALIFLAGFLAWKNKTRRMLTVILALAGLVAVQIAIGLYQARNGVPALAVGIHLVLACLILSAVTILLLSVFHRGKRD